jgi:DNA helicase-2/ATP-dependent DNA helicase PcrA
MQQPRPVATQFMADPKPRAVAPRREETPVDPFSPAFRQTLQQASGGRFRPVGRAVPNSGDMTSVGRGSMSQHIDAPSADSRVGGTLRAGNVIEHQRFGIGTVVKMEGTGENEKATVEFTNAGTKQLLLKFAKYKILQ